VANAFFDSLTAMLAWVTTLANLEFNFSLLIEQTTSNCVDCAH